MVRVDSSNVQVPGPPSALDHAVSMQYTGYLRAHVLNLDLYNGGVAPADLATLHVISDLYVPVYAYLYNPSADVSAATLGVYTAAAAGGTEIVAPTLLATLNGVGKFQSVPISALTSAIVAQTLYPRLTVAAAGAGTASLVIGYVDLSLI